MQHADKRAILWEGLWDIDACDERSGVRSEIALSECWLLFRDQVLTSGVETLRSRRWFPPGDFGFSPLRATGTNPGNL